MSVFYAALTGHGAIEEIAAVELHTGLVGADFHDATRLRILEACCEAQALTFAFIDDPCVVVTAAEFEGFEISSDALADDGRLGEIHRGAGNWSDFTRWDQADVGWQKAIGIERENVVIDGRGWVSGEIPIRVMNDIENRWRIGGGFGFPLELVVIVERVGDFDGEIAGVTFFAILSGVGELDAIAIDRLAGPEDFIEAFQAAVKGARNAAGLVVGGEGVVFAVEGKLAIFDAVAEAANGRTEVGGIGEPASQGVVTVGEVGQFTDFIGSFHRNKDGTVLGNPRFEAVFIGESEDLDLMPVGHRTKNLFFDFRFARHCGGVFTGKQAHGECRNE